jgi:hypothetical protein
MWSRSREKLNSLTLVSKVLKPLTAKQARKTTNKIKDRGMTYQVIKTLKRIEEAAKRGEDFIVLDDQSIFLYPEDYNFLDSLGYKIIPSSRCGFGKISW